MVLDQIVFKHEANTNHFWNLFRNGELKKKWEKDNKPFPTMEDFLKLHEGGDNYMMFIKEFVRIVVGKNKWKNNAFRYALSSYCSASSEAFCLLTMENNYARWCGMVMEEDYGDKSHSAPPPLYTNAGKSNRNNGKTRPFQGWTVEGYKRFDELYSMVKNDRAKRTRTEFEEQLQKIIEEEEATKRQAKEEQHGDDGEEVAYPSHDFEDVVRGWVTNNFSDEEADEMMQDAQLRPGEEENEDEDANREQSGDEEDDEEEDDDDQSDQPEDDF